MKSARLFDLRVGWPFHSYRCRAMTPFFPMMLLCIAALRSLPASAAPPLPPNSFLRTPVSSVRELIRQITRDRVVALRYARLFRMSPDDVRTVFADLHLSRLSDDRALQIWGIGLNRPEQPLIARVRRVGKGEPIFALADNTPVLLVRCGNPVRLVRPSDPKTSLSEVPYWRPYAAVADAPLGAGEADFTLPTAPSPESVEAGELPQLTPSPAEPPGAGAPTSPEAAPTPLPQTVGPLSQLTQWLAPLPILPALLSFGGRNSNGSPYHPPLSGPTPLPEGGLNSLLGAILLLSVGYFVFQLCQRRKLRT